MIKIQDLVLLTICLFVFYYILNYKKEGLDAVMVTNAFSDLRCLSNNLPIVRIIDNKTLQCLSKSEDDTTNCLTRTDLAINPSVKCNDINTHLVKEIRNKNSPVRKVYDKLEREVNYNLLTCNPDGLNDGNHWCGQLYNVVKNEKCTSNEGKFGLWVNPCKQMPEYAELPGKGVNTFTTTRSQILEAKDEAKLETDMARNKALCGSNKACRDELSVSSGGRNAKVLCSFKNEGNGNIAIYDTRAGNKKVWESASGGNGSAPYKVVLNTDGNLIVQDKDSATIWQSGARGINTSRLYRANLLDKSGKCVLEIRDKDGTFVWETPSQ